MCTPLFTCDIPSRDPSFRTELLTEQTFITFSISFQKTHRLAWVFGTCPHKEIFFFSWWSKEINRNGSVVFIFCPRKVVSPVSISSHTMGVKKPLCKRCKRKATSLFSKRISSLDLECNAGLKVFSSSLQRYLAFYSRASSIRAPSIKHSKTQQKQLRLFKQIARQLQRAMKVCSKCSILILSSNSYATVPQQYWDHLYESAFKAMESVPFDNFFEEH